MRKPALLALADGSLFRGESIGADGSTTGEVVFNTSITGYQEILTDPSYAGQIITFTFPHVGNVGANPEDLESVTPAARGCTTNVSSSASTITSGLRLSRTTQATPMLVATPLPTWTFSCTTTVTA